MSAEKELLQAMEELMRVGMKVNIDQAFEIGKEKLLSKFKEAIHEPLEGDSAHMFGIMFILGVSGGVLSTKYEMSEEELIKLIKESNSDFIKELKND